MDDDENRCQWEYRDESGTFVQCSNWGKVEIGGDMFCSEHEEVADNAYQDFLSMPEP